MQELAEQRLSTERVYDGVLLKVNRDEVLFPDGNAGVREWVAHPGAAAVIPLTGRGTVFMVRQYRYPLGRVTLEIPAGKLDPGEDPETCVRRELKEETGLVAEKIRRIGAFATTPAFTNEIITLFVATDLHREDSAADDDEFLTVGELPVAEVLAQIEAGAIQDAKTIIAFLMAERMGLLGTGDNKP
ncbi:MAG TPA: NUDIX hydrolase [Firmicutes bacterium]|jgi:ADP-ribose pyrophosphatase|nr:NUDIX hydrolase [Bacillota bacterium]HOQ24546.1 NUDIX hydrolase [Bacillota bacterium]HPT67797.1 NUDIX hydrolase [Bacillota bacterium]